MSEHQTRNHAVVIGASMSGLLAARVLADRFTRVTVLDRDAISADALAAAPAQRKGVPQGEHAHGLLARGREIVEELFPGITAELVARGALTGDVAADVLWHCAGGFLAEAQRGLTGLLMSRPLLETQVRVRLAALPNITVLGERDAVGLVASAGRARITGLRVQHASGAIEEIAADLVVDATGGGSRLPSWLTGLGFAAPAEDAVRVGIGYTTRLYRRRPEHLGGRLGVALTAQPPNKRYAAALALEGDRWIVSAGGYFGDHAPADEAGFRQFLTGLPSPIVHELVSAAEPLSDFKTFKFAANTRRRYETLARFPEGLLAIGDAISRFNPVFGQGMTSAATQAIVLRECLDEAAHTRGGHAHGAPLWVRFFARAARVIDAPWSISVGADLGYAETEGPRSPMVSFVNWYIAKLHRAAQHDPALALAFHKVANLMLPPPSILAPGIAWRVLRGNLARRRPMQHPAPRLARAQAGD